MAKKRPSAKGKKAADLTLQFAAIQRGIEACGLDLLKRIVEDLELLLAVARKRLGGRPSKDVDLDRVRALATKGMWKISAIARRIGIAPSTALSGAHAEAIKEAIEDGKAAFEEEALDQYNDVIQKGCHPAIVSALIFKMKQLGWSDKVQTTGASSYEQDIPGARERLRELVLRYRAAKGMPTTKGTP